MHMEWMGCWTVWELMRSSPLVKWKWERIFHCTKRYLNSLRDILLPHYSSAIPLHSSSFTWSTRTGSQRFSSRPGSLSFLLSLVFTKWCKCSPVCCRWHLGPLPSAAYDHFLTTTDQGTQSSDWGPVSFPASAEKWDLKRIACSEGLQSICSPKSSKNIFVGIN